MTARLAGGGILWAWFLLGANTTAQDAGLRGFEYAEGYSSSARDAAIDISFRRFTIHSKQCDGVTPPAELIASPDRITLRIGDSYPMQSIVLQAVDDTGAFIPRAPISASLLYESGLLEFHSDKHRDFRIVGLREGEGTAIFGSQCSRERVRLEVPIIVVRE